MAQPHTDPAPKILVWVDTSGGLPLPWLDDELAVLRTADDDGLAQVQIERERPWDELAQVLLRDSPDIFHFIGHGDDAGRLLVRDPGHLPRSKTADEIYKLLAAGPKGGPRGIFLNACSTARSGPHLIPPGGWMVGANTPIDDDVAVMFAQSFYPLLLTRSASPADAFRLARAHMVDQGFGESELKHSFWMEESVLVPPDHTAADMRRNLWIIFNRSAFRDPMITEMSFSDLDQALEDVMYALGTGQIAARGARNSPFAILDPRLFVDPGVVELVKTVGRRVSDVRVGIAQLNATFPGVDNMILGTSQIPPEDRERFIVMLDGLDVARNQVLAAVNKYMRRFGLPPFDRIEKSSIAQRAHQSPS